MGCAIINLLLIIFIYEASADTQTATEPEVVRTSQDFHYCCDYKQARGNYAANSPYQTNLNTLLSTLTSNTDIDYGFYNFTNGENPDKVYAIGLCRGDINPDECRNCLKLSRANLTELCPVQKDAIGWYEDDKCMLRYSDYKIFNKVEDGQTYYAGSEEIATDLDQFTKDLKNLMNTLKGKAASGDSRLKYDVGSIPGPDNKHIYGLVQCTPDLSGSECDDCLGRSIQVIPTDCCESRTGGKVVRPSCNLRFRTSGPFNEAFVEGCSNAKIISFKCHLLISVVVVIVVPVVVVVAAVVLIYIYIYPKKDPIPEKEEIEIDNSESLQFSINDIRNATDDFSDYNKIGEGGFGAVYKGRLSNGQEIAIKRLSGKTSQGDREFENEVRLLSKLQHRNLVRLLGFCVEGKERLLVYEFVINKSLDYFIFDQTKRAQLDWEKRYKIITGIARGILYLHQDSRLRIIHRDLKPSNILLDEEMNPKLSDFGLARLFDVDQTLGHTNRPFGTSGYMAPEYVNGKFSEKSDVFSFGVLVLEVISGQKNSGIWNGEKKEDLLSIAWRNWREGTAANIVDATLINGSQNEIVRCIHIGLLCVQENVAARPTMAFVVTVFNSHSQTLPVPLEPAYYDDSAQLPEFNSGATIEYTTRSTSGEEGQ
ncbi:hypothetical protein JHK84_029446 [Glycine max]|uniref:Cysteine-rich receptor-like protein kinase 29 n=2 Tax=Glycine soja TaxID=3848 RepID=A0A445IT06_GLYSO|nr:cysteine-rich receptor-like protein kinase 29 [Glycine soja]KAG5152974.1 hypothetical protein JHK84_029446 [Glycine max]RZB89094.1 Cysteine-rich receptor-like protein kinase 29 [Glycine soja]